MPLDKSGRGGSSDDEMDRPSCSNGAGRAASATKAKPGGNRNDREKRKRRIVMRIEFKDSDESSSASGSGNDDATRGGNDDSVDLDARPSCSSAAMSRLRRSTRMNTKPLPPAADDSDSDELHAISGRQLRSRRGVNRLRLLDDSNQSESSSGSEIEQRSKRMRGKKQKYVVSDDEHVENGSVDAQAEENGGFSSDSSSNELLEKCPICLLTFRQQEIGTPVTCEHDYCAACIEAWSKNVQTCPIDRLAFDKIIVRDSYGTRNIVREIHVDPSKSKRELVFDDEDDAAADAGEVTNCEICNSPEREEIMLLCDSCNQGYHMDCLDPPLYEIPEGAWYCDNCVDSNGEDEDLELAEDLHMLYEDIRDMGLPETRLRVRAVQQPRILRTRQNERIRAEVLRRTRLATAAAAAAGEPELETTTTTQTTTRRGRNTTTTTTTRTTTTRRGRSAAATKQRRRRRPTRRRTYVVEYDVNNFDEKFAIKSAKKVIRRRRRRTTKRSGRRTTAASSEGVRLSASKRLAEQLGVKADAAHGSHLSGGGTANFTLFGNANDLEYFSDSDDGAAATTTYMDTGHGTAVQTAVRIASIGANASRTRKALLQGKARTVASSAASTSSSSAFSAASDLLSSIMEMQDRWHDAARNFSKVHISADGSLSLPPPKAVSLQAAATAKTSATETAEPSTTLSAASTVAATTPTEQQAPLYQRGGAGPNFARGGGGGGGSAGGASNYNNRYGGNSNYRGSTGGGGATGGAGGGNQYQRHSTGGMANNSGDVAAAGFGNQSFNSNMSNNNNSNNNNNNNAGNLSFTPFNLRFNQRNTSQQQQQQQRNQNSQPRQPLLPPPFRNNAPPLGIGGNRFPSLMAQQQQQPAQALFGGLPAPVNPQPLPVRLPPVLSVPPPPTPPTLSWNSSLFKLSNDYGANEPSKAGGGGGGGNDDEDSCPNFSIYSQESQAVAKAASSEQGVEETTATASKDDEDLNEDLVQLDDDDEIPLPPEIPAPATTTSTSNKDHKEAASTKDSHAKSTGSELYEPDSPTEEQDESDDENEKARTTTAAASTAAAKSSKKSEEAERFDSEPETTNPSITTNSNLEPISSDVPAAKDQDDDDKPRSTPSPTLRDARVTDSRKGVLELYDDSDWEELDIDKPKEFEKALEGEADKSAKSKSNGASNKAAAGEDAADKPAGHLEEPDRSYTPCLDEKNVDEEAGSIQQNEPAAEDAAATSVNEEKTRSAKKSDEAKRVNDIETELISDEDDLNNDSDPKRRSRSRRRNTPEAKTKRNSKRAKEHSETFKKAGKRQKDRNYRGEKARSKSRRTHSQSSRSRSRSRNRSHSRSRSRSRTRSPRARRHSNSYSRSRSRSGSQSPRGGRYRGAHNSQYNQRDNWRGPGAAQRGARGRFNYRNNQYPQRTYHNQQQSNYFQRPKRRELPRYDVRNVVGASRHQHQPKDRYGRDAARGRSRSLSYGRRAHSRSYSRSPAGGSRSRSLSCSSRSPRTASPKRFRSFSMSPSPPAPSMTMHHHPQHIGCVRRSTLSPPRRFVAHSPSPTAAQRRSSPPLHRSPLSLHSRSRSRTPPRMNGGRKMPLVVNRSRSPGYSPRYTPRLSRSRSKSPKMVTSKKKKRKGEKKKKGKKRAASGSPTPVARQHRISRQRQTDAFDDPDDFLGPQLSKKRRHTPKKPSAGLASTHWSPSPTPSLQGAHMSFVHEKSGAVNKNTSWTPPLLSPNNDLADAHYVTSLRRTASPLALSKKVKRKRDKAKKGKKKPLEKQRKEKKRKRRTHTPEPLPSKEVFASGNNILVSVSFNKDTSSNNNNSSNANSNAIASSVSAASMQQQTTVVTVPMSRDELMVRRDSIERLTNTSAGAHKKSKKEKTRKRKKLEAKPVAIIDLERSPFQVHQEPADVIVLTDSEDANENQMTTRRERRRSSVASLPEQHGGLESEHGNGQRDKTPPAESLDTIMESSYENLPQSLGPKTPPEPPLVKFNLPAKKQHKVRNNPLHDEADDINSADELEAAHALRVAAAEEEAAQHAAAHESQKIGPNTPPESGPCSPDAYDPFEPTKSPSLSPRSPTPTKSLESAPPAQPSTDNSSLTAEKPDAHTSSTLSEEHVPTSSAATSVAPNSSSTATQTIATSSINAVDLVMSLINKPNSGSGQQELTNKTGDSSTQQYLNSSSTTSATTVGGVSGAGSSGENSKSEESGNAITVLSNVLLSSGGVGSGSSQHIPVISSPTPPNTLAKKLTAQLPKQSGSVASSSSGHINLPSSSGTLRNGGGGGGSGGGAGPVNSLDDSFPMEIESPYSPGSADYEDLFEPPPDSSMKRVKGGAGAAAATGSGKTEMFDNLFGSTSPAGQQIRMSSRYNSNKKQRSKSDRRSKIKAGKSDELLKVYDDVPNSAVDLQVKDKFLRKLNRQERVVEEVKLVLKPHFNKKVITKDDYKDIMRRAVPKICHSRSGEINPHKIKNLIDAYVKKFRAKHKKLSLLNTGQVSSAVKCAAYLKKL